MLLLAAVALASGGSNWRLVGAYDAAAIGVLEPELRTEFVWAEAQDMAASCGPAKAPRGMGRPEAEAMGQRLFPTLALVLERPRTTQGANTRLTTSDVVVGLGLGEIEQYLRPAVEPRSLAIHIDDGGLTREAQLIRTQLAIQLCLEHKVGRGWTGGPQKHVRQAFLLDQPDDVSGDFYFGGQVRPVPALLGPPDACFAGDEAEALTTAQGAGARKIDLVPADVWGAGLRACPRSLRDVSAPSVSIRRDHRQLPLQVADESGIPQPAPPSRWAHLQIDLSRTDGDAVLVDMALDNEQLVTGTPLFAEGDVDASLGRRPMEDLLAQVPLRYPSAGLVGDEDRYTVLLIPGWQVGVALELLAQQHDGTPNSDRDGDGRLDEEVEDPAFADAELLDDPVAWLLAHPEHLYVQAAPDTKAERMPEGDLAAVLGKDPIGLRTWGYTVGMAAARTPIVLPADQPPTWKQVSAAQRMSAHAGFLAATGICLAMMVLGLRRLADLWTRVPEERADYWPGRTEAETEQEDMASGPETMGANMSGGQ